MNKPQKIAKKRILMVLAIVLCLSVSIGLARAYFTDYEAAKGGALIGLNGETTIEEKLDENGKTISIKNTGTGDDADMVVRVMIYGDESFMTVNLGSNWQAAKLADGTTVYYYTQVLKPGESTSDIRAEIKGDPAKVQSFDITVVHESSRVVYTQDANGKNIVAAPDGWDGFPVIEAK